MTRNNLVAIFYFFSAFFLVAAEVDFKMAKKAYEQGRFTIAEAYFDNLLREEPCSKHIPDAIYYLINIYDHDDDFIGMLSLVNRFLTDYEYHERCEEVFNLLLNKLDEKEAFNIALDYVKEFDYLITDYEILEKIGYGLFRTNRRMLADYILSLCPQTDTIRVLRATIAIDTSEKREIYQKITGLRGKIYLMEFLLETGDTIGTYELFRSIRSNDVEKDFFYRYTKIARIFDKKNFAYLIKELEGIRGYRNKARFLSALNSGYLEEVVPPYDQEEYTLLAAFIDCDTVSRQLADSANIDLILSDSLVSEKLRRLRKEVGDNYFLDSVYAQILLDSNKIDDAFMTISPYLQYTNTVEYARKIRALKYHNEGEFRNAAKDIIMSHTNDQELLFILANSLTNIGVNSADLYRNIIKESKDTLLTISAIRQLVKFNFENEEYQAIVKHNYDLFRDDTTLMKIYLCSLARLGDKKKADSIFNQFFQTQDYDFLDYYGEYLIEERKYQNAADYYDSIVSSADGHELKKLYYNWAFVPFLQGKMDTALVRFIFSLDYLHGEDDYCKALFKIATINYLSEDFDTAAFYYGLASDDDLLRRDALQNQLICYKKGADWKGVIETGEKILPAAVEDEEADILFEIGYAYLRSGNAWDAIIYLKKAIRLKSAPSFHYWLGEAYFSKGDFTRALYQYQKIADLFAKDEMWVPTAQYKTGIVLEFMDEIEEAKRIYELLVKKRGLGDTWGMEAQKRLEELK